MSEIRDAELAVIGCLMADPGTVPETMGIVREEDFQSHTLRSIFHACRELFVSGEPVDPITVLNRLPDESRADYKAIIVRAVETMPSTRGYADYARIVRQDGQKARAAALNGELMLSLSSGGSLDECQELAVKMCEVLSTTESGKSFSAKECLTKFYAGKQKPKTYIPTGISRLDKNTYIDRGDYVIIGGRPSAGKTALTLQLMLHMARKYRVAYFSLETNAEKLTDRMVANFAGLPLGSIKQGEMDWEAVARSTDEFCKLHFSVVEASGWTVQQIRAEAVKLGAEILFIDYLGLIKSQGQSRYEKITNTSVDLHVMAQQTGMTVFALSQLKRGDGEPGMDDLRESGQLEQDADVILLIQAVKAGKEENPETPDRNLIIAKNKDGMTGSIRLQFNGQLQRFCEVWDERA